MQKKLEKDSLLLQELLMLLYKKMEKKWSKFWKSSIQSRKQRKYAHNAPLHIKHKFMSSGLSKDLRNEYKIRSIPVRKGDTVTLISGSHKGKSGKVTKVSLARTAVFIEGVEVSRADGTKALYPVHPSNIKITKLDLSDKKRTEKIEKTKKINANK